MTEENADLLANVNLVPMEPMLDAGPAEVYVCRAKRAQKPSRIAVLFNGKITATFPNTEKVSLAIPYSKRVLAERFILFGSVSKEIVTGISAYDIKKHKLIDDFFCEPRMNLLGFDVDSSGRYGLFGYIIGDPDFPLIRVFDGVKETWIEIDCSELTDAPISNIGHNIRWSESLDSIELFVVNVETYKDEWRAMPFDLESRTVEWTA